jgi:hypothetical protein
MGRAKAMKLPFEQQQQYQEWRPSETQDTAALRAMSPTPETLAPALQAQYDRAQEQSRQRYSSAYGQNIPETARRAMQGQEQRGLMQDYGTALSQSAYDANQANYMRRLGLAEMTLGRPLSSSSSGFSSAPTESIWKSIIGAAGQVAGGAASAGKI